MAENLPVSAPLVIDDNSASDSDPFDNESLNTASYLSSLSSSVRNYKYENGRRYHAFHEGAYAVPNDEEEQDRMDLAHHIYRLLLKGNLKVAPIGSSPQRVLDLGTGTGIWAIQFAEEFPSAHVIGTDLSPIQPTWVPPNCVFEIDDFESPWIFQQPFDFIYARELEGCVANEDRLFRQAFEHLKPGGYFEFDGAHAVVRSDDDSHLKAENFRLFVDELREAGRKFGKSFDNVPFWKEKMEKAGFTEVTELILKLPLRPFAKDPALREIGKYQQVQQILAVESYAPGFFGRALGWSEPEIQVLIAKIRKELSDKSIHAYVNYHFLYGRKPEKSDTV